VLSAASPPEVSINELKVSESDLPGLQAFALMTMLEVAQSIPDAKKYVSDLDHLAWNAAVRGWFEKKLPNSGEFVHPATFMGNEMSALRGLPVSFSSTDVAKSYGYGWAAVIEYLTARYGQDVLRGIYAAIQSENKDPVEAMFENIPEPAYNWWPQFVQRYVSGEIYSVEDYRFLSNIDYRYTIDDASDTSILYWRNFPQLSVNLYRFDLEYALVDDDAIMEFDFTSEGINLDYLSILVYKISDGDLTFLAEGNPVTVSDVKDLTLAGDDLLAFAVNSYNEEPYDVHKDATFTARVISELQLDYNYCEIKLVGITGHVHYSNGDEGDYTTVFNDSWAGHGTFTGNVFSTVRRKSDVDESVAPDISVVVDRRNRRVISFSADELHSEPGYTLDHSVESVQSYHIPMGAEPGVDLIFQVEGSHNHPCDYFDYEAVVTRAPPEYEYRVETTTDVECLHVYSSIMIKFFHQ
jgi:hypothetical protein